MYDGDFAYLVDNEQLKCIKFFGVYVVVLDKIFELMYQ